MVMRQQLTSLPQEMVLWGDGVLASALAGARDFGVERPIVFTNETLKAMAQQLVEPNLANCVGRFTGLAEHALDSGIRRGLDSCIALEAQSIVAIGGGSVLDAAKAVSFLHHKERGRHLPIVALPTTLSGSEFSHYFGVTETTEAQKFKRSYAVRETVPRVVILDPALLLQTPRRLLLSSAIKSIDHAVEGMRRVSIDHPHAVMAASGVARFFAVLGKWPKTVEVREAVRSGAVAMDDLLQLQLASWQCYFSPASVVYGLSHRIGHILGGTYGLPHSVTSCITLAPVIRACADFYGERLSAFAIDSKSGAHAEDLAARIAELVRTLRLPDHIRAFGLERAKLTEVAALLTANYPNEVADLGSDSREKLGLLLEALW